MDFSRIKELPPAVRKEFLSSLSDEELEILKYDWSIHARPNQLLPDTDWEQALVLSGRGYGKSLCIETPIPTPNGFVNIGDLKAGDKVFDEEGKECNVVVAHDIHVPDKAYRLTFSDGATLDVCSEHQWVTWDKRDRKSYGRNSLYSGGTRPQQLPENWPKWRPVSKRYRQVDSDIGPSIKTTQQIVDTFRHGKRSDLNHSIPVCSPVQHVEKDLPIDPYLLGYWLGDGSKKSGVIFVDVKDRYNIEDYAKGFGYNIGSTSADINLSILGLGVQLRDCGALFKESIPKDYYIGSVEQRTQLLRGLMDSDGFCHKDSGHVEFSQKRKWIADLVFDLSASLGQKPVFAKGTAKLYGKDCGQKYRVTWRPTNLNPFRLERKAVRVKPAGKQNTRNLHRMIAEYVEIDPSPMRCLTVDSPNSIFLCGKNYIPTHNTRMGAEWIRECQEKRGAMRMALVGATSHDIRDVMVLGNSGILAISPAWNKPEYQVTKRRIVWPNGAQATFYSSEEPDQLRGPQHDFAWYDEVAACKKAQDTYDQLMFGLRLTTSTGHEPQLLMTTTPRPLPLIKKLVDRNQSGDKRIHIVRGSTFENKDNLSKSYIDTMKDTYGNTRLGKQELFGDILMEHSDALWTNSTIDNCHHALPIGVSVEEFAESLKRIVVGVDPSGSSGGENDAQGIVVVGLGYNGVYYVLSDSSVNKSPLGWANAVVNAFKRFKADKIIVEKNFGGEMVRSTIQNAWADAPVKIIHASRGKSARAEPIALLYEQGKVKHIGCFEELEQEMLDMTQDGYKGIGSPDRADALVWAMHELQESKSKRLSMNVVIQSH